MGEDDRESPPSQPSDRQDAPEKNCEYCGTAIDTSDWYPVTKDRDSDGSLQFYFFCSEACQDAWLDEQPGDVAAGVVERRCSPE